MTATYQDYQKQIAELKVKAAAARQTEVDSAIAQIRAIMEEYELTIADLGSIKQPKTPRGPVAIKYRNDTTGETWTGRGRAPKWLAGQKKEAFLIKQP